MNILDKIVAHKKQEVAQRRELIPAPKLAQSLYYDAPTVSLNKYLRRPDKAGIIAEIKRASPSKGVINQYISVEEISLGYMQAGASALSVLTDQKFFQGSLEDLQTARAFNYCPILRKDFIIDEYQIIEARAAGADAVLLIAAILEPVQIKQLAAFAASLGLEVLLEIHARAELPDNLENISVIGVNNRNLTDFTVDVAASLALAEILPAEICKVSESGISDAATICRLRAAGFQGFLIGEAFMKHSRPHEACADLIRQVQAQQQIDVINARPATIL